MTGAPGLEAAVDCHVHVFDPARFPYDPKADYSPGLHETATSDQLIGVLDGHGIGHALVVNPTSGYGTDNRVTLDAIARHPDRLRGIAVLAGSVTEIELARLKSAGIAGARIDLLGSPTAVIQDTASRLLGMLREQDMVVQLQTERDQLTAIVDLLRSDPCSVVVDHMGRPEPLGGLTQEGFRCLLGLADLPDVAVKLSGPFRFSQSGFPYLDADPFATALVAAFGPERCVWGSDWPFVRMGHRLDYGPALAALARWVPDPSARRTILCETPRRLFGFGDPA